MKKSPIISALLGAAAGLVNGLLGAGGGILAVPSFKAMGLSEKDAHVSSVASVLPITAVSAAVYYLSGNVCLQDLLPYLIPGLIGAAAGALLINKINGNVLRILFSFILLLSGVRTLWKYCR